LGIPPRRVSLNANWYYSHHPQFAAEFAAILPGFGASHDLTAWAAGYAKSHAGRCYWDAQFVGRRAAKRCLNVGGAPYLFEFALNKQFPEIELTSMDLAPERFPDAAAVVGMRTVRANIETEAPTIAGTFDLIVFAEIFEHLRIDILGTMARIRDLLADDGILYLTTPNGLSLDGWRRSLLRGRTGPSLVDEWSKLSRLGHMGHVREYSVTEVEEVLRYSGFLIEECQFRVQGTTPRPKRDLLLKLRPSFADEIVIVARKAK
jgi:SAM-dependent methyltransferase